jgi:small ligand-binding sensory domain FIST
LKSAVFMWLADWGGDYKVFIISFVSGVSQPDVKILSLSKTGQDNFILPVYNVHVYL